MTYCYDYERSVVAATMVILSPDLSEVLLGRRQPTSGAFPNYWCLPGGIHEAGKEKVINTARRETFEEVNIDVEESRWSMFYLDDDIDNDPRFNQVINVCYCVVITKEEYDKAKGGDDITVISWTPIIDAKNTELAFAHNEVLNVLSKELNI